MSGESEHRCRREAKEKKTKGFHVGGHDTSTAGPPQRSHAVRCQSRTSTVALKRAARRGPRAPPPGAPHGGAHTRDGQRRRERARVQRAPEQVRLDRERVQARVERVVVRRREQLLRGAVRGTAGPDQHSAARGACTADALLVVPEQQGVQQEQAREHPPQQLARDRAEERAREPPAARVLGLRALRLVCKLARELRAVLARGVRLPEQLLQPAVADLRLDARAAYASPISTVTRSTEGGILTGQTTPSYSRARRRRA
jgi:hypothetical protein